MSISLLKKRAVGVDISDNTIEIAELSVNREKIKVTALGRVALSDGIIKRGRILDEKRLALAMNEVFRTARPKAIDAGNIVFSIPESQAFLNISKINSKENKGDINDDIFEIAKKNIPIDKDDLIYGYKIFDVKTENKNKFKAVIIIGCSRHILQEWNDFFKKNKMDLDSIDIESLSIYRGLVGNPIKPSICVVDIGAATTNIIIFSDNKPGFSHTINIAGNLLTNNLSEIRINAEGKKLGLERANELKKTIGLTRQGQFKEESFLIISNCFRSIAKEIKTGIEYYNSQTGNIVTALVFVGGTSKTPGLIDYFRGELAGIQQKVSGITGNSNPNGIKIQQDEETIVSQKLNISLGKPYFLPSAAGLEYIGAIGAAVFVLDKHWQKVNPVINLPDFNKEKKEKEHKKKQGHPELKIKSNWIKTHKKETQLLAILLIGLIMILGAFWYRSYNSKKQNEKELTGISAFQYSKDFEFKIPIAVSSSAVQGSRVRGRIINEVIDEASSLKDAKLSASQEVEADLVKGEKLWSEPINKINEDETIIFPLEFKWLVFFETDARNLALNEAKALQPGQEFLLDKIEFNSIESGEDPDIYYLLSRVYILTTEGEKKAQSIEANDVSTDNDMDNKEGESESGEIEAQESREAKENEESASESTELSSLEDFKQALEKAKQDQQDGNIIIKDTPADFLNVRDGAGTDFPVITKVYPGEKYYFITEQQGWTKIKISDEIEGWVINEYIEKIIN